MATQYTDTDIITLFIQRNQLAVHAVAVKYEKKCMGIAMRILKNTADAEECVNDTWLKVWQNIPQNPPKNLSAYLCRITRNLAINAYNKRKNSAFDLTLDELAECLPDPDANYDQLPNILNAFLETLPALDRKLFMGRYWHTYPVKKLAKAYGMTPNAVSLRLLRTREKLREELQRKGISI